MDYNPELSFLYSQIMAAASYSQLAGTGAHHNDGGETPPVSTVVIGGAPLCCKMCCGTFVPLAVNGNYSDPNGDGKSYVGFNRTTSPWCGIPVASVLSGDLTGLIDRDNLARLNPNSGSIRLRMEWSGYERFESKINMRYDTFKIEDLVRKVCAQVKKFIDKPLVDNGPAPEWIIGEGGIKIEHLVLVSLKRISVGCWVPCIRLQNCQSDV